MQGGLHPVLGTREKALGLGRQPETSGCPCLWPEGRGDEAEGRGPGVLRDTQRHGGPGWPQSEGFGWPGGWRVLHS